MFAGVKLRHFLCVVSLSKIKVNQHKQINVMRKHFS